MKIKPNPSINPDRITDLLALYQEMGVDGPLVESVDWHDVVADLQEALEKKLNEKFHSLDELLIKALGALVKDASEHEVLLMPLFDKDGIKLTISVPFFGEWLEQNPEWIVSLSDVLEYEQENLAGEDTPELLIEMRDHLRKILDGFDKAIAAWPDDPA